ncbi:MAG: transposase [Lachnospiraceae bacterium]|nr:transposase [Lachnospiraceae bacterium]
MRKYSVEDKLRMVKLVLEEKHSIASIAASEGIHPTTLEEWVRNYQVSGIQAFHKKGWTKRTSAEKEVSVQEYLYGLGSLRDICKKYKISSMRTLRQWISLYNGHKKLNDSGTGGSSLMTKGRKTTFEERVEIASYCISHDHNYNYAEASEKFKVSY